MTSPRETLKEKMLKSPVNWVVDTEAELQFILHGDIYGLIQEVNDMKRPKDQVKGHPMDGLMRDPEFSKEPDHKAHLDKLDNEQVKRKITFEEAVKPLIQWMAENECPHSHVVVSGVSAELFHGQKSFNTFEFVRDQ